MKEYKKLSVDPGDETDVITALQAFGWKLETSREVYNESEEITGIDVNEKVTTYGDGIIGGFLSGWTGSDGKVERQVNVQTQKKVTHYVSLVFARDTDMKHYAKIAELERECMVEPAYERQVSVATKPKAITVVTAILTAIIIISLIGAAVVGMEIEIWEIVVCVVVPVIFIPITVAKWVKYKKRYPLDVQKNKEITERNANLQKATSERRKAILNEVKLLLADNV